MEGAKLVARGIAQVGEVELSSTADSRRVLTRRPSTRQAGGVPTIHLLGRVGREADSAAVGARSRPAVDRLGDGEDASRGPVEHPPPVVMRPGRNAERAQGGVVELG